MAKRKKTDTVQLKIRIREALRKRLETAARAEDISLNNETARRLENSFLTSQNTMLLEVLLAPGLGLVMLRAIATVLRMAGSVAHTSTVADAIHKVVAVFIEGLPPVETSFPQRHDKTSGDRLAYLAVLTERFHFAIKNELKGKKS